MTSFARTDTSVVGRWWWTVDRWTLAAILLLMVTGAVLTLAASPAVADRLGLGSYHFVRRQFAFLAPALLILLGVSLLTPRHIRRLGAVAFAGALCLVVATLFSATEVKGASRWLYLGGFTLQPSEFLKPAFVVVTAWMFAEGKRSEKFPAERINLALLFLVCGLLVLQPDFGQAVLVGAVWLFQFLMAGLSLGWLLAAMMAGMIGAVGAYLLLPHVASRIDRFLDPATGDTYQIDTALDAFRTGGLFGRGPGEGIVKRLLPDAHTDFIFAVAGEEFGLMVCLLLAALFAFVVLRGFSLLFKESDYFVLLSASGLLALFGLQSMINMGVNLNLLPAKGMTLPFISYGGSSLLALSLTMGMVLALTRTRVKSLPARWELAP